MRPAYFDLVPDQIKGADFLQSRPVTMLADAPGLGKTAQAIHAFDMSGAVRGTYLCPPVIRPNVAREFARWSLIGHKTQIVKSGADKLIGDGVVIVSYDMAANPKMRDKLRKRGGDWLFLDEAHKLKEGKTKRAKAVLALGTGLAATHKNVVWMTGTPMPNNPSELYNFCKQAGLWPANKAAFISTYCVSTQTAFGSKIVGAQNQAALKSLIAPAYLRRVAIEGLPELVTDVVPVTGDIALAMAGIDPVALAEIEAALAAGDWQFMALPHVATVRRHVGLAKAESAAKLILSELEDEPAIVVFALHRAVIGTISAALKSANIPYAAIVGDTPPRTRQQHIDAFQGRQVRVLVCQMMAANEGITLTAARRVILAEAAWTPAPNEQAIARCHRRGQGFIVRASYLSLKGSIDDRVNGVLSAKRKMIKEIV